jgi:hypothetical protein
LTIRLHVGCDSVIFFQLAGFTSLRIISQSLVGKKQLFARAKDKLFTAIDAP